MGSASLATKQADSAMLLVMMVYLAGVLSCEYSHIDTLHTMCVFQPRMCAHRKLLRR